MSSMIDRLNSDSETVAIRTAVEETQPTAYIVRSDDDDIGRTLDGLTGAAQVLRYADAIQNQKIDMLVDGTLLKMDKTGEGTFEEVADLNIAARGLPEGVDDYDLVWYDKTGGVWVKASLAEVFEQVITKDDLLKSVLMDIHNP